MEHITRFGRQIQRSIRSTAVTPLAEGEIEINYAIYWTAPALTLAKPDRPAIACANSSNQDRERDSKSQREGLQYDQPSSSLIDDVDTQAKWYFRLEDRICPRQDRAGRPFNNPVTERVLRWRS